MKFASLTLIAFVVTLSIGCKHGPKNITQIPGGGSAVAGNGGLLDTTSGGTVGNGGDVVSVDGVGNIGLAGLDEFENMLMNREAFSAQTVYFGFIVLKFIQTTQVKLVPLQMPFHKLHKIRF